MVGHSKRRGWWDGGWGGGGGTRLLQGLTGAGSQPGSPSCSLASCPLGWIRRVPWQRRFQARQGLPLGSTLLVLKAGGDSSAELSGHKGYCLASRKDAFIRGDD